MYMENVVGGSIPKSHKLSPAMKKVLDKHINAPYADYNPQDCNFYLADGPQHSPMGYGKYADGTIKLINNTVTLKALEDRGYIEIVEVGGAWGADSVRLLKHENNNRSVLETHNMVRVDIYTINTCTGRPSDKPVSGGHYIENGDPENAKLYWDYSGVRADIARIVDHETGEEIYKRK
ncbi:hypothetical protein [Paenibacillus polymyxa]|uniref:hypothetical protein n=1 Tax=Paenibacillus polymyxa TaxID=1406 RepID=UPI0004086389|nr:hypothetical protein [Paenibacillus polymyxa]